MSHRPLEEMSKEELIREIHEIRRTHRDPVTPAERDPDALRHELQVHQIELEMQNRELREAQVAVEESRARYADLYDFAPVGYLTLDPRGVVLEINLTGASLLGEPRERILGRRLDALAAIPNKHSVRDHLQRCAAGPDRVITEITVASRTHGRIEVQMVSVPSRDQRGSVTGWRTVLSDITSLKALEHRLAFLAEAGDKLGSFLDYASTAATAARLPVPFLAGLCILDDIREYGEIRRIEVVFHDPGRQALFADALRREDPATDSPVSPAAVITSGEPVLLAEVPAPGAHMSSRAVNDLALLRAAQVGSLMIVPLTAHGRVLGALTLGAVDTTRRYGEDDLRLAQDYGGRVAMALDNARLHEQERRAIQARESLLAIVSHDLRNPLSVVTMKTDTLLRSANGDPDARRRALTAIRRSAARMRRLISDLLDASSIEAGHLTIEKADHPVAPLVAEVIEALGELAAQGSVRIEGEVAGADGVRVSCDRGRILQVLTNLVENAIKFSPPGETIVIRAAAEGPFARFSVADRGPGISPDHLPHIFDRFWQAPETARRGTGLGLSIARGIVEAHGGEIWVETRTGAGSTFFFTMPIALHVSEPAAPPPAAPNGHRVSAGSEGPVSGRTVLIVDDDPDAREALAEALANEGLSVAAVANGAEALDYLRRMPPPGVVLLDMNMPVMDGPTFLTERSREPSLRSVPVIVLSAQRDIDDRILAQSDGHVTKPVDSERLLRLLLRVSERG